MSETKAGVTYRWPRPIWVFSLAVGELAVVILSALALARLNLPFSPAIAIFVAFLAPGFLAYRLERRYPGIVSVRIALLLAAKVSILLSLVNGFAYYVRGIAPNFGYVLMITALGTLLVFALHALGIFAGVKLARLKRG